MLIVANDFHRQSYANRIIESKKSLRIIDKLRESIIKVSALKDVLGIFAEAGTSLIPQVFLNSTSEPKTRKVNSPSEPKTPMPSPARVSTESKTNAKDIKSAQLLREDSCQKRQMMADRLNAGLLIGGEKRLLGEPTNLLSDQNALSLGHKLFVTLAVESQVITVEAFYPYFESQEEAEEAFNIFDRDGKTS